MGTIVPKLSPQQLRALHLAARGKLVYLNVGDAWAGTGLDNDLRNGEYGPVSADLVGTNTVNSLVRLGLLEGEGYISRTLTEAGRDALNGTEGT